MKRVLAVTAFGFALLASQALAQTVAGEAALRQSVAVVVARGINSTDSAPLASQGTGFFINSMGVIVTSYHLRGDLPQSVQPESISYEVHLDALSPPIPATKLFESPETDVLVLYAPVDGKPIGVLKRADRKSAKIDLAKTPVYAVSYASGYNFSMTPGVITSWSGPINPVFPAWTTNVSYASGQSGSPLVLEDGRVIAIVKGADAQGATIGIVVPILFIPPQFWESDTTIQNELAALPPDGSDPTSVVVSKVVVSAAPRTVVRTVVLQRAPCDPSAHVTAHFSASPGWSINKASIVLSQRAFKGKSLQYGTENVTSAGFDVAADMESNGTCNAVFGQGVAAGDPAVLEAQVKYKEAPDTPTARRVVVAEAAALTGLKLPVGKDAKQLDFALRAPDGSLKSFTPTKAELRVNGGQAVLDVGRVLSSHQ